MAAVIAPLLTCVERDDALASIAGSLYRFIMRSGGVHLLLATCLCIAMARPARTAEPDATRPLPVSPGREVVLEGEVVDLECFLRDGSRGERHKGCALTCRKNGGSLAIVEDKTGDLYPVAGNAAASDPGAAVAEFIGARVSLRGELYERSGARILVVGKAERLR
jgi:hypothetical protein